MDRTHLHIVQTSFQKLFSNKVVIARLFYDNLFQIFPESRKMFKEDLRPQLEMFAAMLVTIVRLLGKPDELAPVVSRLAQAHARFELTPQHYALATEALLDALRQYLQEEFTPEVEDAWRMAMQSLMNGMVSASSE